MEAGSINAISRFISEHGVLTSIFFFGAGLSVLSIRFLIIKLIKNYQDTIERKNNIIDMKNQQIQELHKIQETFANSINELTKNTEMLIMKTDLSRELRK